MKTLHQNSDNFFTALAQDSKELGLEKKDLKKAFLHKLFYHLGRMPTVATKNDLYTALSLVVRDRAMRQQVRSTEKFSEKDARAVAYFSAEYLPGPHLGNNLLNLGIIDETTSALKDLELDLDEILQQEVEPGLGNGGLGRLASCYMSSLATLGIPAIGYGIRYEFGIFKQEIQDGWQAEVTDKWLNNGNPWELMRPELTYAVKFGGHTEAFQNEHKKYEVTWHPEQEIRGIAYDTPVLGYHSNAIIMRLWKAEAVESFDFSVYNKGDYYRAVEKKVRSENITKVLYPNDEHLSGKELRLKQQYFFVSCSLQDMIHLQILQGRKVENFHQKFSIQLNDTHPSIAVAELMRLLVDEHHLEWNVAWGITTQTFAYTNHTLLPEALEKWTVSLLGRLLPRHLEIIYEINRVFLDELRKMKVSGDQIARMSLIDDHGDPSIRMAHLAVVGSYKVNGVSALHSELLKSQVLHDFSELWPDKFTNVTNGVDHRRFLITSNPKLTKMISEKIGDHWLLHLNEIKQIEQYAEEPAFQKQWQQVKFENKEAFAKLLKESTGVTVSPHMLFDVQVKRIHEYKRQHLMLLHILHLYLQLKDGKGEDIAPSAFIFAGKAAPGYHMAKLIIKLVDAVATLVNDDEEVNKVLKVAFLPNFNVKKAQVVYPAADLSEQISMAGKEASGTGNMKFAMNGALTLGTLDGANVEIREEVGEENFFLFGQTAAEVQETRNSDYRSYAIYEENKDLRRALDFLISDELSQGDPELFRPLYDSLLQQDSYQLLKDFESYSSTKTEIYKLWQDKAEWTRRSILNVSRTGKFSSDRSIEDYCKKIWKLEPVLVQ